MEPSLEKITTESNIRPENKEVERDLLNLRKTIAKYNSISKQLNVESSEKDLYLKAIDEDLLNVQAPNDERVNPLISQLTAIRERIESLPMTGSEESTFKEEDITGDVTNEEVDDLLKQLDQ